MRFTTMSALVAAIIVHAGCGDSVDGPNPPLTKNPPLAKSPTAYCNEFVDMFCGQAADCGLLTADECEYAVRLGFEGKSCADADQIRSPVEMDTCIELVDEMTCSEFETMLKTSGIPSECNGQVLFYVYVRNAYSNMASTETSLSPAIRDIRQVADQVHGTEAE